VQTSRALPQLHKISGTKVGKSNILFDGLIIVKELILNHALNLGRDVIGNMCSIVVNCHGFECYTLSYFYGVYQLAILEANDASATISPSYTPEVKELPPQRIKTNYIASEISISFLSFSS